MSNKYELKNDGYTWLVYPTTTGTLGIEIGNGVERITYITAIPNEQEDVAVSVLSECMETAGEYINVDRVYYSLMEKMGHVAHLTWGDIRIPLSVVNASVRYDGVMVVAMGDAFATFITGVDLDMDYAELVVRLLRQRLYEYSRNSMDIEYSDLVESVVDDLKKPLA